MMYGIGSPKVAMLLISLGIGYLVCVKAEAEKGFLKQLGYWIGTIIIVLSILAGLGGLYHKTCGKMPLKYQHHRMMSHPMPIPMK